MQLRLEGSWHSSKLKLLECFFEVKMSGNKKAIFRPVTGKEVTDTRTARRRSYVCFWFRWYLRATLKARHCCYDFELNSRICIKNTFHILISSISIWSWNCVCGYSVRIYVCSKANISIKSTMLLLTHFSCGSVLSRGSVLFQNYLKFTWWYYEDPLGWHSWLWHYATWQYLERSELR